MNIYNQFKKENNLINFFIIEKTDSYINFSFLSDKEITKEKLNDYFDIPDIQIKIIKINTFNKLIYHNIIFEF